MKFSKYLFGFLIVFCLSKCKKSEFLNAKPDERLVIPESLADYKALLNNTAYLNGLGSEGVVPAYGQVASDDYYTVDNYLSVFGDLQKNLYTWSDDLYSSATPDWVYPYRAIFYANVILDGIQKLSSKENQKEYEEVKGSALFFRSFMLFNLAQVFAPPYDPNTASVDLGVPLRLSSDINEAITRPTLKQTYDKILADLEMASNLLPDTALFRTQPSKAASYGLLSKIYLTMRNYDNALLYSSKCLQIKGTLIDYNLLSRTSVIPFYDLNIGLSRESNSEIIFDASIVSVNSNITFPAAGRVDSLLYGKYEPGDLRKIIFFRSRPFGQAFKGSYSGSQTNLFAGIATDEIYLIYSECLARKGLIDQALSYLNLLLVKRWEKNEFSPIAINDKEALLQKILLEKRKQLIFRGVRWMDIRRLNQEGANIFIKRTAFGQEYTLHPNSKRYTYLIPLDVISFNPKMPQNGR